MYENSRAPYVDRLSVGLPLDDLWGHEVGGAYPTAVHTLTGLIGLAWQLNGHSEAAQLYRSGVLFAAKKEEKREEGF